MTAAHVDSKWPQTLWIVRHGQSAGNVARDAAILVSTKGYVLREVSVSSADQEGVRPYPRPMAMQAKVAMAEAAVPVEAGKSTVNITVSGSVQLR